MAACTVIIKPTALAAEHSYNILRLPLNFTLTSWPWISQCLHNQLSSLTWQHQSTVTSPLHCGSDVQPCTLSYEFRIAPLPPIHSSQPSLVPSFTYKQKWWLTISNSVAKVASHRSIAKYNICDCSMISFSDSRYIMLENKWSAWPKCEPFASRKCEDLGISLQIQRRVWFIYV